MRAGAALLLLLCAAPGGAEGRAAPARGAEPTGLVPRKVLALYSRENVPGEFKDPAFTQLHLRAELPLNHLGLELVYQEASGPLPDPAALEGFRGVLTWFEKPVNFPDPVRVCRWLDRAMAAGLKLVVLGDAGLYAAGAGSPRLPPECAATFRTLGVALKGTQPVDPLFVEIVSADASVMGFERKPDLRDVSNLPLAALRPGGTAYLRLELAEGGGRVEPVGLTPRGAIALHPFALYSNEETEPPQLRWIVDPFAFFERAFRLEGLPRPDVSTLNGRRLYFSHVDGDGFFNRSELDPKKWSGEVFLREFIERRPESPLTVSLITGYYDMAIYSDAASLELSRAALTRPNVEPASHGYAHPLVWRKGTVALKLPGYVKDSRREILESAETIAGRFLLRGRRPGLFLWTGDCLPSEEEIALPGSAGMLNMNGGGGRFDRRHPSYAYLHPVSRVSGRQRQIYAPASNENVFTNLWEGPYYGYRDVLETFERTGAPRRVKPVDVYVHFYSAEKYAAVEALRKVYAWAHAQPLFPVWAGRYVRAALGFFSMGVERLGEGRFRFAGGGELRTVRFDGERREPDLARSKGVVGFKRELGSLYVFFDESETRELALAAAPPRLPYVAESNFEVSGWERRGEGLRFLKSGWWAGELRLGGLAPGRSYSVASGDFAARVSADAEGFAFLRFPDSERGGAPREVRVEREG